MARIRTIKPEFFSDDEVAALPPLVRLLFIAMWCHADKAGRLKDRPASIKARCLPFDDLDGEEAIAMLADRHFIFRYESEGVGYIQVRTWEQHQRPHHTEQESVLPPCDNRCATVLAPLNNGQERRREGKGEGKGKEGEKEVRAVARFVPPSADEVREYAEEAGLSIDAKAFVDFYSSKGWKVGKSAMKDWRASARNADRGGWCAKNGTKSDPLAKYLHKGAQNADARTV